MFSPPCPCGDHFTPPRTYSSADPSTITKIEYHPTPSGTGPRKGFVEMESDGVMDGRHSTFENVFEMRQKVGLRRRRRRRDKSIRAPQREQNFVRIAHSDQSCFNLQIDPSSAGAYFALARLFARSDARMPAKPHIKNTDGCWQACSVTTTGSYQFEVG